MTLMAVILVSMGMLSTSPVAISVMILSMSVMATIPMYKTSTSSWMSFILIITFSSGMMTLFMYTTSLATNEVNKTSKKKAIAAAIAIYAATPPAQQSKTQSSMKFFSKNSVMMAMASMLIITMVALVSHGHSPHQTLNSSF